MGALQLNPAGLAALAGRIFLLGCERVAVKRLGSGASGASSAFLFFSIATLCLAPVLLWAERPAGFSWLPVVAANGLLYAAAFVLYASALSRGEASFVSPFYNFNLVFLLLLAVVLLGEALTAAKVGGVALLVAGGWLLAAERRGRAPGDGASGANRHAAALMVGCSLLMAGGRTVDAWLVREVPASVYAFAIYGSVTLWLGVFVAATRRLREVWGLARTRPVAALAAGTFNAFSYLLLLLALRWIEVSVAEPASMLSLLVTLGLAAAAYREPVGRRVLPTLLMIGGAWLLLA